MFKGFGFSIGPVFKGVGNVEQALASRIWRVFVVQDSGFPLNPKPYRSFTLWMEAGITTFWQSKNASISSTVSTASLQPH